MTALAHPPRAPRATQATHAHPLAALVAQRRARLVAALPHQIASQNITLRWIPDAATAEERLSVAALLLAGTGFAITPGGADA
jgi:hypothetical protein